MDIGMPEKQLKSMVKNYYNLKKDADIRRLQLLSIFPRNETQMSTFRVKLDAKIRDSAFERLGPFKETAMQKIIVSSCKDWW